MSDRMSRLQAILQGANGAANGTATAATPPPPPQAVAPLPRPRVDLAKIVQSIVRPQAQPAPQPQAPPAATRGPAQAMQQKPAWRLTPDGSFIAADYTLEWHGMRGLAQTPVSLRRSDGSSVFDGAFGVLQRNSIDGVWVPYEGRSDVQRTRAMQAQQAMLQGMGAAPQQPAAPPASPAQGNGTVKKVAGVALGLAALGLGGWSVMKLFSEPEEDKG